MVILFALGSAVLAALVAVVELLSRYRDDPFGIIFGSVYSWAYFSFNAFVGFVAFFVLWAIQAGVTIDGAEPPPANKPAAVADETDAAPAANAPKGETPPGNTSEGDTPEGQEPESGNADAATTGATPPLPAAAGSPQGQDTPSPAAGDAPSAGGQETPLTDFWYYALAAGFGGSLIIRSRIITVRSGTQDVAIGPSVVVDQFLFVLDRQIDRKRAIERMNKVRDVMHGIDFVAAEAHVVNMIINGLQNMTAEEREDLTQQIQAMSGNDKLVDDQEKAYVLGYLILDIMGEKFLNALFDDKHRKEFQIVDAGVPAADARVDDAEIVKSLFQNVTFAQARQRLDAVLDDDGLSAQRDELTAEADKIAALDKPDQEKAKALAYAVIDAAGIEFLQEKFADLA